MTSALQTQSHPKHVVVGASVAAVLAFAGSGVATLALGPFGVTTGNHGTTPDPVHEGGAAPANEPMCRNIFDQSGSLCVSVQPPPDPPIENGILPWCQDAPHLVGVVFDVDDTRSLALFEGLGPRPLGAPVGPSTVAAIHDDEVWLVTTTERCRLGLFDPEQTRPIVPVQPPVPPRPAQPQLGIRVQGNTTHIAAGTVQRVLANPTLLGRARLVPLRGGHSNDSGFRLYGIRGGDALHRAGLRNGDKLRELGDVQIKSQDDLLDAYGRYAQSERLKIVVERRGQLVTLWFSVEQSP